MFEIAHRDPWEDANQCHPDYVELAAEGDRSQQTAATAVGAIHAAAAQMNDRDSAHCYRFSIGPSTVTALVYIEWKVAFVRRMIVQQGAVKIPCFPVLP